MEDVIVYADDVARARAVIAAMRRGATHWMLVACPPRITQRSGQWASRATRERWRRHWADRLLAGVRPVAGAGDRVSLISSDDVPQLAVRPDAALEPVRIVDARRERGASDSPGAMLPGCSSSWSSGC